MQEIQLDKHITLLDSPGVLFSKSDEDGLAVLRNAVRVSYPFSALTNFRSFRVTDWLRNARTKSYSFSQSSAIIKKCG